MKLLDEYKKLSTDDITFQLYTKCGTTQKITQYNIIPLGNYYWYRNTNFRKTLTFVEDYITFKPIAGIERENWPRSVEYNQELFKTMTVRMRQSKIFSIKNKTLYQPTAKGILIDRINTVEQFKDPEKWILTYFLILDGYFNNVVNYIFNRTQFIMDKYSESEIPIYKILDDAKTLIDSKKTKLAELTNQDFLYEHTFLSPLNIENYNIDFKKQFFTANNEEKQELFDYVKYNVEKGNSNCIISKKFESSGNYDLPMLLDDAKTLYMSIKISLLERNSFENFVNSMLNTYSEISPYFNRSLVKSFIMDNSNVFQEIYFNLFNLSSEDEDIVISENEVNTFVESEEPEARVDVTIIESQENVKKKQKRSKIKQEACIKNAGYRCELEQLYDCKYFVSKKNNRNYVEGHHLIPMKFENDFEYNIDVLANLVSLCPACHMRLHHASDAERKTALTYLYNQRKEKLERKGIGITKRSLFDYYKVD